MTDDNLRAQNCEKCGLKLQGMTSWFNGDKWYCYTCWLAAGYDPDGWLHICKFCGSLFFVPDNLKKSLDKPFCKGIQTCYFCHRSGVSCSGYRKCQVQTKLTI